MNSTEFTYWLNGFFELSGATVLSEAQVKVIKEHLGLVFKKVTTSDRTTITGDKLAPNPLDKSHDFLWRPHYPTQPLIPDPWRNPDGSLIVTCTATDTLSNQAICNNNAPFFTSNLANEVQTISTAKTIENPMWSVTKPAEYDVPKLPTEPNIADNWVGVGNHFKDEYGDTINDLKKKNEAIDIFGVNSKLF